MEADRGRYNSLKEEWSLKERKKKYLLWSIYGTSLSIPVAFRQ